VLHRDKFNPSKGESIATSYLNVLMPPPDGDRQMHAHGIADRFFASECIYGDLFRDGCRMTPNEHFIIKTMLLSYGAFVVHCDPPNTAIRKSWKEREQLYDKGEDDDTAIKIADAYRQRLGKIFYPIPVIMYDWTHDEAGDDRVKIILQHQKLLHHYSLDLQWSVTPCHPNHTAL
jgi:hypothetical protein